MWGRGMTIAVEAEGPRRVFVKQISRNLSGHEQQQQQIIISIVFL